MPNRMSKGKISAGGLQLPAGTPIAGLAESVVIVTADTTLTSADSHKTVVVNATA